MVNKSQAKDKIVKTNKFKDSKIDISPENNFEKEYMVNSENCNVSTNLLENLESDENSLRVSDSSKVVSNESQTEHCFSDLSQLSKISESATEVKKLKIADNNETNMSIENNSEVHILTNSKIHNVSEDLFDISSSSENSRSVSTSFKVTSKGSPTTKNISPEKINLSATSEISSFVESEDEDDLSIDKVKDVENEIVIPLENDSKNEDSACVSELLTATSEKSPISPEKINLSLTSQISSLKSKDEKDCSVAKIRSVENVISVSLDNDSEKVQAVNIENSNMTTAESSPVTKTVSQKQIFSSILSQLQSTSPSGNEKESVIKKIVDDNLEKHNLTIDSLSDVIESSENPDSQEFFSSEVSSKSSPIIKLSPPQTKMLLLSDLKRFLQRESNKVHIKLSDSSQSSPKSDKLDTNTCCKRKHCQSSQNSSEKGTEESESDIDSPTKRKHLESSQNSPEKDTKQIESVDLDTSTSSKKTHSQRSQSISEKCTKFEKSADGSFSEYLTCENTQNDKDFDNTSQKKQCSQNMASQVLPNLLDGSFSKELCTALGENFEKNVLGQFSSSQEDDIL